jgi:hypothetical protein
MKTLLIALLMILGHQALATEVLTHVCYNPREKSTAPEERIQGTLELWHQGLGTITYVQKGKPMFWGSGWGDAQSSLSAGIVHIQMPELILIVNLTANKVAIFDKAKNDFTGVLDCERPSRN